MEKTIIKLIICVLNNDFEELEMILTEEPRLDLQAAICSIPENMSTINKDFIMRLHSNYRDSLGNISLAKNHLTLLHLAALADSFECFLILEKKGVPIDCLSADGYQPIHYSCCLGALEVFSYIISKKPDVLKKTAEVFLRDFINPFYF